MNYKRVLLKLSGEALMGEKPYGIDPAIVQSIAEDSIINYADLVTEMKLIRHPFKEQGIKAQKCIEF